MIIILPVNAHSIFKGFRTSFSTTATMTIKRTRYWCSLLVESRKNMNIDKIFLTFNYFPLIWNAQIKASTCKLSRFITKNPRRRQWVDRWAIKIRLKATHSSWLSVTCRNAAVVRKYEISYIQLISFHSVLMLLVVIHKSTKDFCN